jgi:hypothetical protein
LKQQREVPVFCGQCGTENSKDARECVVCGSSLTIQIGGGTCDTCGAAVGADDRYCRSCGEIIEQDESSRLAQPGASFGDDDLSDVELSALPDWLRDLAPSEVPAGQNSTASSSPSPDDLPDWLREIGASLDDEPPGSSTSVTSMGPVHHQPAAQFELVSDDDLPDWLKALGDDDSDEPERSPFRQSEARPSNSVAVLALVPAVSRAWLRQGRSIDLSSAEDARREFAPLHSMQDDLPAREPRASTTTEFTPVSQPDTAPQGTPEQVSAQARRSRVRIFTLALLIVVILLLTYVVIQSL